MLYTKEISRIRMMNFLLLAIEILWQQRVLKAAKRTPYVESSPSTQVIFREHSQ